MRCRIVQKSNGRTVHIQGHRLLQNKTFDGMYQGQLYLHCKQIVDLERA